MSPSLFLPLDKGNGQTSPTLLWGIPLGKGRGQTSQCFCGLKNPKPTGARRLGLTLGQGLRWVCQLWTSVWQFSFLFEWKSECIVVGKSLPAVKISYPLLHACQPLILIKGRDAFHVIQQSFLMQKAPFESLSSLSSYFLHQERKRERIKRVESSFYKDSECVRERGGKNRVWSKGAGKRKSSFFPAEVS